MAEYFLSLYLFLSETSHAHLCLCSISSDAMFRFSFLAVKDYPHGFPCDGWEIFTERKSPNWRENEFITFFIGIEFFGGDFCQSVFCWCGRYFLLWYYIFPLKTCLHFSSSMWAFTFKSILICITFYEIFKLLRISFPKVGFKG